MVDRNCAIHCVVQLRASQVENPRSNRHADLDNCLRVVDRDAKAVAEMTCWAIPPGAWPG